MKKLRENIKVKYYTVKLRVQNRTAKIKTWAYNNPEQAAILLGAIVSGIAYFGKAAIRHINLRKQEAVKVLYCYDRSLGHYWRLKRELSNREWLEIEKRKQAGEKLANILDSMKVLK